MSDEWKNRKFNAVQEKVLNLIQNLKFKIQNCPALVVAVQPAEEVH
jgi:hypothetical protein